MGEINLVFIVWIYVTHLTTESTGVQLKIRGEAKTSWTDYVADHPQTPLTIIGTHHRAVKYFANEVFFEKINVLVGCKGKQN